MEVVIWSSVQVKRNLAEHMTIEMNTLSGIRKRKLEPLILRSENEETFSCSYDMEGTIPGGSTIKLLEELAGCKTILNSLENDDVEVEGMTKKIIRMVNNLTST